MSGTLYIVATPIGNLEDLTPRARRILTDVDLIAAEDTRHTGRLLSHIGAKTPQTALHDHNESEAVGALLGRLEAGASVALVSDAGTPLVSDPGYRLVRDAHAAGIAVSPVPGPSAVMAALAAAGLATDRFAFEGFPPAKKAARIDMLSGLANEPRTLVFFEAVHRVGDCISDMVAVFGKERRAFIGRELTKLHEQCVSATLGELGERLADSSIARKGEFVIVVAGAGTARASSLDADRLLVELAGRLPAREVAAIAAAATGEKKNALYARLLELTAREPD